MDWFLTFGLISRPTSTILLVDAGGLMFYMFYGRTSKFLLVSAGRSSVPCSQQ